MGRKRERPTIIEAVAASSTAAADTSFAILAWGRISGLTRLTIASKVVLKSSSIKTKEIVKRSSSHS